MFADGGLLALGANVFNMGIVNVCGGYCVFFVIQGFSCDGRSRATVFAAAFAGWFGTVLASITCAGELALSGTVPWADRISGHDQCAHGHRGGRRVGDGLWLRWRCCEPSRSASRGTARTRAQPDWLSMVRWFRLAWWFSWPLSPALGPMAWRRLPRSSDLLARPQTGGLNPLLGGWPVPAGRARRVGTAIAGAVGNRVAFVAAYLLARCWSRSWRAKENDGSSRHLNQGRDLLAAESSRPEPGWESCLLCHWQTAFAPRSRTAVLSRRGWLLVFWPLEPNAVSLRPSTHVVAEFFILGIALLSFFWFRQLRRLFPPSVKSNLVCSRMVLLTWTTPFHGVSDGAPPTALPRGDADHAGLDVSIPAGSC